MIGLDRHLERLVVEHRVSWLDWLFRLLSQIGTLGLVWLAIAAVLALLWRRPGLFVYVLVADVVADLLAAGLKNAIDRPRPAVRYPDQHPLVRLPHDGSFPSGHAATSFACATVLSRVAPRLSLPLFALALAIAFSRVYNAVHYPLDVLGGAVLGVLTALLLLRVGRRRWSRAQRPG